MQQQNQKVLSYRAQPEAHDQPLTIDPTTAYWLRQTPTAAFDALLDQADPQAIAPISAEARESRRLCGRWLAMQRLRLGVVSQVIERAGMDAPTLHLIESGLADVLQVPESIVEQFSALLADAEHDQGWVRYLLLIAVGRSQGHEEQILQRVVADLSAPRSNSVAPAIHEDDYELFRRAITARDADAWAAIHARYRPLLIAWVQHRSATAHCDEAADDLADRAFARAWAALVPSRFADFPSLAALLAYLRVCVSAVVIDQARAQAARECIELVNQSAALSSPEQLMLDSLDNAAFWQAVIAQTASPAERVILIESFIHNSSPRAIQAHHPELFVNVAAVYTAKRNLLTRLQRNAELWQLRGDSEERIQ